MNTFQVHSHRCFLDPRLRFLQRYSWPHDPCFWTKSCGSRPWPLDLQSYHPLGGSAWLGLAMKMRMKMKRYKVCDRHSLCVSQEFASLYSFCLFLKLMSRKFAVLRFVTSFLLWSWYCSRLAFTMLYVRLHCTLMFRYHDHVFLGYEWCGTPQKAKYTFTITSTTHCFEGPSGPDSSQTSGSCTWSSDTEQCRIEICWCMWMATRTNAPQAAWKTNTITAICNHNREPKSQRKTATMASTTNKRAEREKIM